MVASGIRNPHRILPSLKKRSNRRLDNYSRWIATWGATRELPRQLDRINEFRDRGSYLLIVLDACRYDVFGQRFSDLFEGNLERVVSEGHDTFEYARENWHRREAASEVHNVTYVSGAVPINSKPSFEFEVSQLYDGFVPEEHIKEIVDVWETDWDTSVGTVPPGPVAHWTLERRTSPRLVAHFFQPHSPYIGEVELLGLTGEQSIPGTGRSFDAPIWEKARSGDLSDDELLAAYASNLDAVLPAVCRLVAEFDRPIALIGDHGEALGEYGVYHHRRTPHPNVRVIPFATIDGLTPQGEAVAETAQVHRINEGGIKTNVEERLRGLGYL